MKPFMPIVACLMGLMIAATCGAYPLDGYGYTGIARVEAYRLAMEGKVRAPKQPPGALLPIDQVDIRLAARSDVEIPPPDAEFAARLKNLLGAEADRYAVSVLDLSNPELPRYAEHRSTARANPGSVDKILIALGLFQAWRMSTRIISMNAWRYCEIRLSLPTNLFNRIIMSCRSGSQATNGCAILKFRSVIRPASGSFFIW